MKGPIKLAVLKQTVEYFMEIIGCELSYRKYIALSPFFLKYNASAIIFL